MSVSLPAGWYGDPLGRNIQRYWNGASWTPYVIDAYGQQKAEEPSLPLPQGLPTTSAGGHAIVIQNIVQPQPSPGFGAVVASTHPQTKSMAVAVVLTVLFGPLGLLYVSVLGGIILLVVTLLSAGILGIVTWPAAIIWAVIGVNKHNAALLQGMQSAQPIHSTPLNPGVQIPPPIAPPPPKSMTRPRIQLPPRPDKS